MTNVLLIAFEHSLEIACRVIDFRHVHISAVITAMTSVSKEALRRLGLEKLALPYERMPEAISDVEWEYIVFSENGGETSKRI